MNFNEIVLVALPSVVTVLGFFVTYYIAKKSIVNEITKSKRLLMIEKGTKIFSSLILVLDGKSSKKINERNFSETINDIYIYGSKETISLFASFQQYNYLDEDAKGELNNFMPFAYICLLLAQLKFDVTGEIINPMEILRIRINDFETNDSLKDNIPSLINNLVEQHKLNNKFKFK